MNKYNELQQLILSCILLKPELIENKKLEDKYFVGNERIWNFMKSYYKKFKNFDLEQMCLVASNKYKLAMYITELAELEPTPYRFEQYLDLLIELYEESKKELWLRKKIFELSNDFYLKSINSKEFLDKVNELYKGAEELFKNDD